LPGNIIVFFLCCIAANVAVRVAGIVIAVEFCIFTFFTTFTCIPMFCLVHAEDILIHMGVGFFRHHHQIEICEIPDFEVHKKYTAVFHITKTA
jgi:hypothetical protein